MQQARFRQLLFHCYALLICLHFSLAYMICGKPLLNIGLYVQGADRLPYQARCMMMFVLRGAEHLRTPWLERTIAVLPGAMAQYEYFVIWLVGFASIALATWVTGRSLRLLGLNAQFANLGSLLVPLLSYFHFCLYFGPHFIMPYDLPALAFYACGLYLILANRTWLLAAMMPLAVLNREVTLFLVLFYFLAAFPGKRCWAWSSVYLLEFGAVKLFVNLLFLHNEHIPSVGGLFVFNLFNNLMFFVNVTRWPALFSVFGFTLPILFMGRHLIADQRVRRWIWVLPAWGALMVTVGLIIEIRIFAELIPYMAIALSSIAWGYCQKLRNSAGGDCG